LFPPLLSFCSVLYNIILFFPLINSTKKKTGPPKTATTHIQCGLEKYSFRLAKEDKYHYLGGGCGVSEQGT
jgi:hypothetical protein